MDDPDLKCVELFFSNATDLGFEQVAVVLAIARALLHFEPSINGISVRSIDPAADDYVRFRAVYWLEEAEDIQLEGRCRVFWQGNGLGMQFCVPFMLEATSSTESFCARFLHSGAKLTVCDATREPLIAPVPA